VPGPPVTVTLCAESFPVVQSGRLSVHVTAGRQAQVLASGTLGRIKTAVITALVQHAMAVDSHCMLHESCQNTPKTPQICLASSNAAQIHKTTRGIWNGPGHLDSRSARGRSTLRPTGSRICAGSPHPYAHRTYPGHLLATGRKATLSLACDQVGMRLNQKLLKARENKNDKLLVLVRRAMDYRSHRPSVEAVIHELTRTRPQPANFQDPP
jgi:hypothetical protein